MKLIDFKNKVNDLVSVNVDEILFLHKHQNFGTELVFSNGVTLQVNHNVEEVKTLVNGNNNNISKSILTETPKSSILKELKEEKKEVVSSTVPAPISVSVVEDEKKEKDKKVK